MSGQRRSVAGSLLLTAAVVVVLGWPATAVTRPAAPPGLPAAPLTSMITLSTTAPASSLVPHTDSTRSIPLTTVTSVERVKYRDGSTDTSRPFKPVVAGDAVYLRVAVVAQSKPLPGSIARLRLQLGNNLADADVQMVERDGVRRCVRIDHTVVSCVVAELLTGDEASMLVRVVVPAGLTATDLWFRGTVVAIADADVTAEASYARLDAVGRGAWSGTWHWYATWDSGSWDGDGMQIRQVSDSSKRVVCAQWPWSGGGAAWGTVNDRGVWHALWRDGFGEGTWKLSLTGASDFAGTQLVDVYDGDGFTADITGRRTSTASPALDCDAIQARVS